MVITFSIAYQGFSKYTPLLSVDPRNIDSVTNHIAWQLHNQGDSEHTSYERAAAMVAFLKQMKPDSVDSFISGDFKMRAVYLHPTDFTIDYSEPGKPKFVIV